MAKLWKILALLLVITALVWLTTLWRWQSAQFDPSPADLALNLGILPLALTAALIGTLWAVKRLRSYAAAPTAAPPATQAATPSAQPAATAASERSATVRVLAASTRLRAGSDWNSAHKGIATGECKPGLDAHLKDDDGIAVFTAPMPDLSIEPMADTLPELISGLEKTAPDVWTGYEAPTEMQRALVLLQDATSDLSETLEAQWPVLGMMPPVPRSGAGAPPSLPPCVAIRVGIPARWSPATQQLATRWIEDHFDPLIEAGLKAAGQSRAMASAARPAVQLHVHAVDNAEAFWLLTEQQLRLWNRDKQPGLLLALAADSLVGDGDVAAMSAARELFSGHNQQGRVPGEAAAGLLLASATWPAIEAAEPPMARLAQASLARRDKSADASGRVSPHTLIQAVKDALQGTGLDAGAVQHVTTDADHRASRTGEVYETVQELMPHVDPGEHALRLGMGCGDLGVARLLACAALTATQVRESNAPALVMGAFAAHERLALLVMPAAAPTEAAAPPSAQPA